MKRLYTMMTLVIMMLVSLTTSAQVKSLERSVVGAKQVEGTLTAITASKQDVNTTARIARATAMEETNRTVPAARKAPKKVMNVTGDTWHSLGTGTYTDDFLNFVFSSADNYQVEVEIEESNEHPGVYRLLNPYQAVQAAWGGGRYDSSANHHMIIHTEDGENAVWMEHFNSGLYPDDAQNYGEFYVMSYPQYFVKGGQAADIPTVAGYGWCGTISDGVINLGSGNYFCQLLGYSTSNGWTGNKNGLTQIVLPGVDVKDYSVRLTSLSCQDDNSIAFSLSLGTDIASAKFGIFGGRYSASEKNLAYVGQAGTPLGAGAQAYNLTDPEMGTYTVMVAGLDAGGNVVGGAACYTYVNIDDNDNWTSLGMTMYGEDIIATYYQQEVEEYEVELQQHNEISGYYRIVNPYTNGNWSLGQYNGHSDGHNHYIYIHAEDPEKIWINESAIGADMGDGVASVCSYAVNFTNATDEDWGYYDGNKIVFPVKTLVISEANYQGGDYALTNISGGFYVAVPTSTIKDKLDFVARKYTCSSGMSTEGDITEKTTYNSDGGHFTFTVNVAAGSTANRFWSANNGSQLRMYGVSAIVVEACEGYAFREVTTTGSSWATNTNYTANGLTPNEIKTLEGGSASASKMVWTGNSTNFILEVVKGTFLNDISVVMEPTDNETTTYTLPVRDAAYTMTATLEEDETKLTALSLGSLKYHIINTGDITITKGETEVATIASSDITIASNAATITLDTPITEAGEYTITAPEGLFIYGGYIVGEKTIKVEVKKPTGIESVSAAQAEAQMFNLNGQAVKNAQRGLYIIGGKKVVK